MTSRGSTWTSVDLDALADAFGGLMAQIVEAEGAGERVPCRGGARLLWTSERAPHQEIAAMACHDCPALDLCRTYALENNEIGGTWGGLTPADRIYARRTLKKENKK